MKKKIQFTGKSSSGFIEPPKPPTINAGAFMFSDLEVTYLRKKIGLDDDPFVPKRNRFRGDGNHPNNTAGWARIVNSVQRMDAYKERDRFRKHNFESKESAGTSAWRSNSNRGFWWGNTGGVHKPHPSDRTNPNYKDGRDMTILEPDKKGDIHFDASFYALVTDDLSVAKKCREHVLYHTVPYTSPQSSQIHRLDMNDTVTYPRAPIDNVIGTQFLFLRSNWLYKFLGTYDYTKHFQEGGVDIYTPSDKAAIAYWFNGAINYYVDMLTTWMEDGANWNNDGTYRQFDEFRGNDVRGTLSGNYPSVKIYWGAEDYSNRALDCVKFIAYASHVFNHAAGKVFAKRFYKAAMNYAFIPVVHNSNTMLFTSDHNRSFNDYYGEELPLHYGNIQVNSMIAIADAFARGGDYSLYDYVTDQGEIDFHFIGSRNINSHAWLGKTLYKVIKDHIDYWVSGTPTSNHGRANHGQIIDADFYSTIYNKRFKMIDLVPCTMASKYYKWKTGDTYIEDVCTWKSSINHKWYPPSSYNDYVGSGVYYGKDNYNDDPNYPWLNYGGSYHEIYPDVELCCAFWQDAYNPYFP